MRISHGYGRGDVDRLCELNDTCFEGLERPPRQDFQSVLSISEVFIARTDAGEPADLALNTKVDHIVGYIVIDRRYGAYLWSVAVDPLYRTRGIANYLMTRAEQFCKSKGDTSIRLHCNNSNPSQKLYFNRGYRVYDLSPNYYGAGTVALMMQKGL